MKINTIFIAIVSSLLVACGGNGGDDSSSSQGGAIESVGVFIDSPVRGLRYETPTRSGLTNSRGEFRYLDGETVTFSLGATILGAAQGAATITPFSLFDLTALTRESEITGVLINSKVSNYDRALNVASLLQTLDLDSNPENGINLGAAHSELFDTEVNLSVKAAGFIKDASLEDARSVLGIRTRMELREVAAHLYESLNLTVKSDLVNEVNESLNSRHSIVTSLEYDDNGQVTSKRSDTDNDSVVDTVLTYTYDAAGNLTGTSNSATNITETLSYDDNNNLVSHTTGSIRQPGIKQTFTFNDDNKLSLFEVDMDSDGKVESASNYLYDAEGKLTTYEVDQDNDGNADALTIISYDNDEVSAYAEDSDNNGDADLSITYQYDSEGNRISQNVNASAGGLPRSTGSFEYDTNGNVTRYEQDNDQDGRADYIESSVYDSDNNRLFYRRDLDADGTWDTVAEYTYDADGNRTSMQEDSNGDGTIDKQWSSEFDTKVLSNGWDLIQEKLDAGA